MSILTRQQLTRLYNSSYKCFTAEVAARLPIRRGMLRILSVYREAVTGDADKWADWATRRARRQR